MCVRACYMLTNDKGVSSLMIKDFPLCYSSRYRDPPQVNYHRYSILHLKLDIGKNSIWYIVIPININIEFLPQWSLYGWQLKLMFAAVLSHDIIHKTHNIIILKYQRQSEHNPINSILGTSNSTVVKMWEPCALMPLCFLFHRRNST